MVATPRPTLTPAQVDAYLARLGIEPSGLVADLAALSTIHLAHLERIPFENLDIVFGNGVRHDQVAAVRKIVASPDASRGGWCFELNGALAMLLDALGYDVRLLGAAVLLDGPSEVIEHMLLEVTSPHLAPHLVDVGFGDGFDVPLALNTPGTQNGGSGEFELIGSPQGTTVARLENDVPNALMRFKRVAHSFEDFAPVARSMQADPARHWSTDPFASRRLTDDEVGGDAGVERTGRRRVTLTGDRLKFDRFGIVDEDVVERGRWASKLHRWFEMSPPGPWPTER